jgi:hypothetical protein
MSSKGLLVYMALRMHIPLDETGFRETVFARPKKIKRLISGIRVNMYFKLITRTERERMKLTGHPENHTMISWKMTKM